MSAIANSWTARVLSSRDLSLQTHASLLAVVVHQIFRLYETYSIPIHVLLLLGPPVALALHASSEPSATSTLATTLVASVATYLIALSLSVLAYRLSPFHPLARYPGPVTHRLSKLWMGLLSLPGYQHKHVQALHERYGDVVRIGPNELSICDPPAVSTLLGASGLPKGPHFLGRFMSASCQAMVALQDTDTHMRRRRPWARGLNPSAVKEYEEAVAVRVKQLMNLLEEEQGPVALDRWIDYFAYDFMSDMAFGGGSELLSSEGQGNIWATLERALCYMGFLDHVAWLGEYVGHIPPAAAPLHAINRHCEGLVRKRLKRGSVKKDLFYYLNREDTPETGPPPMRELVDDGIVAVVAGSDTVASAMTSTFCCLMAHSDAYRRLQAEVDQFYPPGEDVMNTQHHASMQYLTAVINEALRLFPPVPACTQREEPRNGRGTTVGSIYIPPRTMFCMHSYTMQRDPRNFSPAPDTFWPERWLIASGALAPSDPSLVYPSAKTRNVGTQESFVHNEEAHIPFSYGPMNCVGKGLAWLEMRTVVCALMQRFEISPAEEGWELGAYERELRDYFVTTRGTVPVKLEVRSAQKAFAM